MKLALISTLTSISMLILFAIAWAHNERLNRIEQTRLSVGDGEAVLCKRVTAKVYICRKLEAL